MALIVELGPAKGSSHSTAEQHRIEEDKTANSGVRVLAKDHQCNKPDSRSAEVKLAGGVVGHGNADDAKQGIESTHKGIIDILGVLVARFELERSIVSTKNTRQSNKHLSKRGVDIEVVFMLDVVAAEFTKAVIPQGQQS